MFSVFSLTNNLITPKFLCITFYVYERCFFGPETRVLLQPVRRSPRHMLAAADTEPDCSYSLLAPVKIYIKGPDFRTKLQQDIAEQSLPLPKGSRMYLSRCLLTNNPDPCQKSSAVLIAHINENRQ